MGLVVARGGLDARVHRHHAQDQEANATLADLDRALRDHGLARRCRGETNRDVNSSSRSSVDTRRWTRVHRRSRVLCGATYPLQPFHLAPVRDRRHDLPLLRRALVRGFS